MEKAIQYIEGLLEDFQWKKARNGLFVLLCVWLAWSYFDQFRSTERLQRAQEIEKIAAAKLAEKPSPGDSETRFWQDRRKNAQSEMKYAIEERYSLWRPLRWGAGIFRSGWPFLGIAFFLLFWFFRRWEDWEIWQRRNQKDSVEPSMFFPLFWLLLFLGAGFFAGVLAISGYESALAGSFEGKLGVADIWATSWEIGGTGETMLRFLCLLLGMMPFVAIGTVVILDLGKDAFRKRQEAKQKAAAG